MKDDLEVILNIVIDDKLDYTNLVIKLFMDCEDKEGLLKYLYLCDDEDLRERLVQRRDSKKSSRDTIKKDNRGYSLEEWLPSGHSKLRKV